MPITTSQKDYSDDTVVVPPLRDLGVARDLLAAHRQLLTERTTDPPTPYDLVQGACLVRRGEDGANGTARILLRIDGSTLRAITYSKVDGRYYGVSGQAAYVIDPDTGHATEITPPPEYPRFSWLGGVTYDPQRKRIVITSLWFSGYHHTYDPVTKDWRVFPIEKTRGGLHAVAYSPEEKLIYGLVGSPNGSGGLALYDSDLTFVRAVKTSRAEALAPGSNSETTTQLAILGRDVVACTSPPDLRAESFGEMGLGRRTAASACDPDARPGDTAASPPLRCFLVSPASGEVRLLTGAPIGAS